MRKSAAPPVVGQAMAPAAELLSENTVLLDQSGDGQGLLALQPAGDGGQEKVQGLDSAHGAHARRGRAQVRRSAD
ncbi:MAG: hypothetical protein IPM29_03085 [Planctomycetes bacterium]|nr:hypothetical protein [Planctomycetota bacterium]